MMIHIYVVLTSLLADGRERMQSSSRPRDDRGAVSLEQVVISLGLFLLAAAVVAGITAAVNGRLGGIK